MIQITAESGPMPAEPHLGSGTASCPGLMSRDEWDDFYFDCESNGEGEPRYMVRYAYEAGHRDASISALNVWQPIETAPMDGTAIWLLWDGQPFIGYGEKADGPWRPRDIWFAKASFRRREQYPDEVYGCHGFDIAPTHWMPLPDAPK